MLTRVRRSLWFLSWLLVALLVAGCGSDPAAPSEQVRQIDYELFPSTHQLSASDAASISEVAEDGTLRFKTVPAALAELKVGEVVLSGISETTPYGLLRVVLAIEQSDTDALVLRTAAAPLQVAFRKLHAKVADLSTPFRKGGNYAGSDLSPLSLAPQFSIAGDLGDRQNYKIVVFDGDGNTDTTNDQVLIDTTLGGGFRYALSIDMDWDAVDHIPQALEKCLLEAASVLIGKPSVVLDC